MESSFLPSSYTSITSVCIYIYTGTVFLIAKHEFETKRSSVEAQADAKPLLNDIVDAGKVVRPCIFLILYTHHTMHE